MTEIMERESYGDVLRRQHDEKAPVVPWEDFYNRIFKWEQGEHVACIGPTSSGKTVLSLAILDKRQYIVAIGTKPKDDVLQSLVERHDYKKMVKWDKHLSPGLYPKRLLWPDATKLYSARHQQKEIGLAFQHIYREGGWCVFVDELWYITASLKMEHEIRIFLQQSRSNHISLLLTTQRPARVPLEVFDQSTHLFFWRDNDERNLKNISGIGWLNASIIKGMVARLERYQFLYINTRTGEMYRCTAPPDAAKI